MTSSTIIEQLGFNRTVPIRTNPKDVLFSQAAVLEQIKNFGIDAVHFCDDENNNSYPAVFIKSVISFDTKTLQEIAEVHRQAWNYKKVLFLYVHNEVEIRIYNCAEKPYILNKNSADYEKELRKIELVNCSISDKEKIKELSKVFSSIGIDTGIIWTLEEAEEIRKKINLQRRVDKYLVDSLIRTAKQLQDDGLDISVIHKVIMRSLFLLYLEDRGATNVSFYGQIKSGTESYFDLLDDVDATYLLYKKLEDHFNGNVFSLGEKESINRNQLQLIKNCFISGNDGSNQEPLFKDWRLFDFSIIQIELLSEIYESFLAEIEPEIKQQTGTYFTPPALVELILNEKLSVSSNEDIYNLKILDPTCGSGIFLVESFKRLVKRYENKHKSKLTDFETLKKLLTDNIFGIEIHPQSIKVAAFSLYLALVDNLNPKTIWQDKSNRLPNLINNPNDPTIKEQGMNLFCRDTIEDNKEIESINFDLIVGNPPFGTKDLLPSVRKYCDQFGFAKEMVLPFLHKSTKFSPNGEIALIFNTKVLTNTNNTYQKFRHWLFNDCYVEKVYNFSILRNAPKNFGGQLFGSATGPISIVFFRKEGPIESSSKIMYYAPKTFIKSNVLEGVVIDSTDVKYLSREDCKKADSKIWKIAMWGGIGDIDLIDRLKENSIKTVGSFIEKYKIKSGVGFQLLTQKKDNPKFSENIAQMHYLDAEFITRYYTDVIALTDVKSSIKTPKAIKYYLSYYNVSSISDIDSLSAFRRLGDEDAYKSPHIVVKKGLENNSVCASILEKDCSFRDGVYGFYTKNENKKVLYALMSYFNSRISSYYLFMTISSYGIEREQIMKNEYLSIPINIAEEDIKKISEITDKLLLTMKSISFLQQEYTEAYFDEEIESIIKRSLGLTNEDVILINDTININLDLFHKKEKSKALLPIIKIDDYANMLCEKLNAFLEGESIFANATTYSINTFSPLMMMKISFQSKEENVFHSSQDIGAELKVLDKKLWEEKASNIYFRKKLNYKSDNDIFIIRPNQRRFWTQTMAMEDAAELILEILNED